VIQIPGYGRAVVADRGGTIRGRHVDLFFATHAQALAWGTRRLALEIR
jgi:3D (Asp-Asp-Asp) domain-containing protein